MFFVIVAKREIKKTINLTRGKKNHNVYALVALDMGSGWYKFYKYLAFSEPGNSFIYVY